MNIAQYWSRKGFFYYAHLHLYNGRYEYRGVITKKLDFITFHIIKYIHGEEKLKEMALRTSFKDL